MITITIPTKGRPDRLLKCVESIDIPCSIIIVATEPDDIPKDNEAFIAKVDLIDYKPDMSVVEAQIYAGNIAHKAGNHVLPIADDIEFLPGSLREAEKALNDDVVGLNVVNMEATDTAFMLISHDYYGRCGGFNAGYRHFYADTEFGNLAKARGKFKICKEAKILHYHPAAGYHEDATHRWARRNNIWKKDDELYNKRINAA